MPPNISEPRSDANVGSRARDHLANERTFLAWVRTALGGSALGIALERFGSDRSRDANPALSAFIVAAALAVPGGATMRYYKVAQELDAGRFSVDRRSPVIVLIGALAVVVLAL